MTDEASISLNPSKPSELEFDVTIQGLEDTNPPTVRFTIIGAFQQAGDLTFSCEKRDNSKDGWAVKMPALPDVAGESSHFRVEVIIDGYYFEPAHGSINYVKSPDVQFTKKSSKRPSVSTSFTVKQDAEDVKESAGGGDIVDHTAPTNAQLRPEFDPSIGQQEDHSDDEPDPQSVDPTEIASSFQPGQSRRDSDIERSFDPKQVASDIVKSAVGNVQKPEKRGSLFSRGASGKTMIPGLEDRETKQTLNARAAKVKEILGSTE